MTTDALPTALRQFTESPYAVTPTLRQLNQRLARGISAWKTANACLACGSVMVRRFATIRHLPHSRCRACGFTFTNPLPPDEVLHNHYNSPFYNNYRRLEARRICRDGYFSISMYTDMARLAGWIDGEHSQSILDYGCGPGAFLAFLRDRGGFSNVEGLEVNQASVDIARSVYGLPVASSPTQLTRASYDFVILIEVIEHVPNPGAFFAAVADLVVPGGQVLITTPAIDNLVGRYLPTQCGHYVGPNHVSLFTEPALRALLARFGFTVERLERDEGVHFFDKAGLGLFYDLDFVSPQGDADDNDAWYTPTRLGRLLGLRARRPSPPGRIRSALRFLDWFVWRAGIRFGLKLTNQHFYALARKTDVAAR